MYRLFRDATRYMEGHHVKVQSVCRYAAAPGGFFPTPLSVND